MLRLAEQIRAEIKESWLNSSIAHWVLGQLELLQFYSEDHIPSPIYTLTINHGRYYSSGQEVLDKTKFVISGGLEGTRGHIDALHHLHEARALMAEEALVTVLLEADNYILESKQREPLISQAQRAQLWSKSGLVDLVVCLPVVPETLSPTDHYQQVHEALGGTVLWFATDEHPFFLEVLSRGSGGIINLLRLMPEHWGVHASFLSASKTMEIDEFNQALSLYSDQLWARLGGKRSTQEYNTSHE